MLAECAIKIHQMPREIINLSARTKLRAKAGQLAYRLPALCSQIRTLFALLQFVTIKDHRVGGIMSECTFTAN